MSCAGRELLAARRRDALAEALRTSRRTHRLAYRRWRTERDACLDEIDALLGAGGDELGE
ncbi:MAG: hypothetical protein ACHQ4H_17935 [Ktedonobacterales bacterium]